MGMFDYVSIRNPTFVCSEGHDLSGEEFQTKEFDCVLGYIRIDGDTITTSAGPLGVAPDLGAHESMFDLGCDCRRCPAFVQGGTFNLCPTGVEFRVHHQGGRVIKVTRISPSTAEYLATEPEKPYMAGCRGPMPYEDAARRHRDRAFHPLDPIPMVSGEVVEAQRKWAEMMEADRKRWTTKRGR